MEYMEREIIDILAPYIIISNGYGVERYHRIHEWSEVPIVIYNARGYKRNNKSRMRKIISASFLLN
jgi:hypothetical protein